LGVERTGRTAWLAPGYPFLLSLIFRIWGVYTTESALVALFANAVFSTVTGYLIFLLAKRLFHSPLAGLGAVAIWLVHPSSLWYTFQAIWDTTLTGTLVAALLLAVLRLGDDPSVKAAVWVGGLMTAIVYVNPATAPVFPFLLGWAAWRIGGEQALKLTLIPAAMALVLALPWQIRNQEAVGRATLRCCFGLELMLGNNETTWQNARTSFQADLHPGANRQEFALYKSLGETDYDRRCLEKAIDFIRQDYGRFAVMTLRRVRAFWLGEFGSLAVDTPVPLNQTAQWIRWLTPPVTLFIGLLGLVVGPINRRAVLLLGAFVAVFPLPAYLASVNGRLKFPVEICLIVAAAPLLARLVPAEESVRTTNVIAKHAAAAAR
jgi:hypothetical protein